MFSQRNFRGRGTRNLLSEVPGCTLYQRWVMGNCTVPHSLWSRQTYSPCLVVYFARSRGQLRNCLRYGEILDLVNDSAYLNWSTEPGGNAWNQRLFKRKTACLAFVQNLHRNASKVRSAYLADGVGSGSFPISNLSSLHTRPVRTPAVRPSPMLPVALLVSHPLQLCPLGSQAVGPRDRKRSQGGPYSRKPRMLERSTGKGQRLARGSVPERR